MPSIQIGLKGISIGDITDKEDELFAYERLKCKFIATLNLLNYYTVRQYVKLYMTRYKQLNQVHVWQFEFPMYPLHMKALLNKQKSSKNLYCYQSLST